MICPICKSSENWPIVGTLEPAIAAWREQVGSTQTYSWRLCTICGNGFPSEPPAPAVLDHYWQVNRRIEGDRQTTEAVWQRRLAESRVGAERSYRIFAPLHRGPPGRFLDIACGLGETVGNFRDHGWRAEGIDLDANTRRFHEQRGLAIKIGRFEEQPDADRYDMIHIAHAIYFITEPMRFLRRVRAQLTPDGIFGVIISDFLAAHDQSSPGYPHTFYPCGQSMRYALALAGLDPVLTRNMAGDIYIAARPGNMPLPPIDTWRIYWKYRTKPLRFAAIGWPYLTARQLGKHLLSLVR